MPAPKQPKIHQTLVEMYRALVQAAHPETLDWPILSGYNARVGTYGKALIVHIQHTGQRGMVQTSVIPGFTHQQIGVQIIDASNRSSVIERLELMLGVAPRDMLIVIEKVAEKDGNVIAANQILIPQLKDTLTRHEATLGLLPMKIFLSHKGVDKPKVREYKKTLELLGFEPWLDEDAMAAGVNLERGLLDGMKASCAAVFFVTPNFVDAKYLGSEVDYATQEKRAKDDRFQIITLVFSDGERKGTVPDLLRPYVWKEPHNDLEGLREILKALPLSVGAIRWRSR